jgi:hypothetical protein
MNEEKSVNEEVLYVIGNGFDINLGLKTRYENYFENFGITQMKEILELFRENEENIKEFNQKKFEEFIEILEKYNISYDDYDSFKINLKKSLEKNNKEEIKENLDAFNKSIFVSLKNEKDNEFLESYGLFIIFLILLKVEKNEWQWVEEQISEYIKDIIDIVKVLVVSQTDKENIFILYLKKNLDDIEKNIEEYTEIIIKEKEFEKAKNKFDEKDEMCTFLIQILKRRTLDFIKKTEKYSNNKTKIEILNKQYRNYTYSIRYKINFIFFSLENFLRPQLDLKFNNENIEIINNNNLRRISLKEELYRFENHFGNYALKVNKYVMNILNKDLERNITKNEFIDIELSLKSEIEKRLKRIFGFETRDKRIISFNYTTYLNYYKNNSNQNIPIKNLKELINVNGNVDDYKKINDNLEYQERKSIEGAEEIINNIICELKKLKQEVQKQCERIDELKYFIEKLDDLVKRLDDFIKSLSKKEIKKIDKLWLEIEHITSINYEIFHIEDKYKEKLKNILSPNKKEYNTEIIFGIDEIQKDENYKELDSFFKSERRSGKLEEKINKLLEKQFSKIYFYGHSLADADFTFFENIFSDNVKMDVEKIDDLNQVKTELVFLYEREFFGNENIESIVKLFYNYYSSSNRKSIKTKDEIVRILSNLRQRSILKIKIRDKNKDEYEEQDNILILDNKEKLEKLLLEI